MRTSWRLIALLLVVFPVALSARTASTPLDRAPPVDVCGIASPDQVRPIVALRRSNIRGTPEKPAPGRGICTFAAHDPGLTADAPPTASVAVEVYRSDDPAWMARNFTSDFRKWLVPSQVRTDDPHDQVARPKPQSVAVQHGNSVVVVDAGNQEYDLQRAPDRVYKLEAFALQLAGATVRGPVDLRTTQDACTPLDKQHVLGILTTEPSSLEINRDGTRCTIQVKDGSGKDGHWVDSRGEVQIERQDLASNAEALRFQHTQTPFAPVSTLVRTADPTDRLVTSSDSPGEVWAVHGANYVTLEVENETAAAKASPGWLFRVQRLAFEAAGAMIVPTPGTPPDPVVPGPVLGDTTSSPSTADSWTPPAHPAPALSWLIDPVVATIAFLASWRIVMMPVFVVVGVALPSIAASRARKRGAKGGSAAWSVVLIGLGVLNIMFGTWLSMTLVYHAGVSGSATVTASRSTSVQYNNHDVEAHSVLIRKPDGKVTETEFEDDDFNVYPSHNETIYPGEGSSFTVRYLEHAPHTFVIVADDDSPWARHLRCGKIEQAQSDAEQKSRFAPNNADYKAAYQRASADARAAKCSDGAEADDQ